MIPHSHKESQFVVAGFIGIIAQDAVFGAGRIAFLECLLGGFLPT